MKKRINSKPVTPPVNNPVVENAPKTGVQYVNRTVRSIRDIDKFTPAYSPIKYKKYFNTADRDFIVDVSRDLFGNSSIYQCVISTMSDLILGHDGFLITAKTKNEGLNNVVRNGIYDFFKNPEVSGRYKSKRFEKMIIDEYFITGEVFLNKTNAGLQIIFSEEVKQINYNEFGKLVSIDVKADQESVKTIPEKNLIYMINYSATSQRGYPYLTSAIPILLRVHSVLESEISSWQLQSRVALVSNRKGGGLIDNSNPFNDGIAADKELLMDYGLILNADEGEELSPLSRNLPQLNLTNAVLTFLRCAVSITGIPAEIFINALDSLNYSQSRLLIEKSKARIKMFQNDFINYLYDPIADYVIDRMKSDGILSDELFTEYAARNTISWAGPIPFSQYMEKWEIQNQVEQIKYGFSSHTQIISEKYGQDRKDIMDQRELEIIDGIERIKRINEKYNVNIPLTAFIGAENEIENQSSGQISKPNNEENIVTDDE